MAAPGSEPSNTHTATLWFGAYTSASGGSGEGIGRIDLAHEPPGAVVAGEIDSPSFIALHPYLPMLYAVSESAGFIHAFRIAPSGQLEALGQGWPTGIEPCHVAVDPQGKSLITSSWGDGSVDFFTLNPEGAIIGRATAVASNPWVYPLRQSRAHCALFIDDEWAVTTDLGLDILRVWRRTAEGLTLDHEVAFPPGSGPRHIALHPSDRLMVVAEFTGEVFTLARVGETFTIQDSEPPSLAQQRMGAAAAHIAINDEGTRAYVALRRSNSVSTFAIDPDGNLTLRAETPCGGEWPRHHALHDGSLYVANERSATISVLRLDDDGIPLPAQDWLPALSPTCIVVS